MSSTEELELGEEQELREFLHKILDVVIRLGETLVSEVPGECRADWTPLRLDFDDRLDFGGLEAVERVDTAIFRPVVGGNRGMHQIEAQGGLAIDVKLLVARYFVEAWCSQQPGGAAESPRALRRRRAQIAHLAKLAETSTELDRDSLERQLRYERAQLVVRERVVDGERSSPHKRQPRLSMRLAYKLDEVLRRSGKHLVALRETKRVDLILGLLQAFFGDESLTHEKLRQRLKDRVVRQARAAARARGSQANPPE